MTSRDGAGDTPLGTLPPHTQVVAASVDTGRERLTAVDAFVQNQSPFDHQARVNLEASVVDVTRDIYLNYVRSQVMPWSDDDIASLKQIIADMATKFAPLSLGLPGTLYLVKTSGQEEGFAAYTRGMDTISLPENMVASLQTTPNYGDPLHPAQSLTYLEDVIIHECFHIFSKNNPAPRERLYALVHYKPTGAPVELPSVPWPDASSPGKMPDFKITNPDTPSLDTYIEMEVQENPHDGASVLVRRPLLPILMASGPYVGGIFFDYLQWYFMAIEQGPNGAWRPLMGKDGRPVLYRMSPANQALWQQYLQLIGRNLTGELFHPDEILAQNFVFVATQPTLSLLTGMSGILNTG
jgi:hypothetical protein